MLPLYVASSCGNKIATNPIMNFALDRPGSLGLSCEVEMKRKKGKAMASVRREENTFVMNNEQEQDSRQVVWTNCPQCGNTCGMKSVLTPGKCPVCGGKPKNQKVM